MTVIELFAGIGSQTQALKNIGIDHKVIGISEIDKYAIQVYKMLHGEVNNFGDITKIKSLPYCDLLTYSFPCQDLSIAGKQAGIKQGTRSGLLYEVERLLNGMEVKPKYLLLENVKNLISEKFYNSYQDWLNKLTSFGYVNYNMLLNAKDYGIPQNRERVFCISIRKDVDKYFWIPEKQELKIKLYDLLQENVDNKYYIKNKDIDWLKEKYESKIFPSGKRRGKMNFENNKEISKTLVSFTGLSRSTQLINQDISYCIDANYHKGTSIKNFQEKHRRQLVQIVASRGRGENNEQQLEARKDGLTNTLTSVQKDNLIQSKNNIRRLTPLECFRLMGFKDEQFNKITGISDTQLYKMAGNSIVVNVLEAIFRNLFVVK